jgi:hypothetical protein
MDGLDKFEGEHSNHTDLAKYIRLLVTPKVKIMISSRPIEKTVSAFPDCPSLQLQALTKTDMEIYVANRLVSHEIMAQITQHYPEDTRVIIDEIQEKAKGVFLWVRFVVRSLIVGLVEGDDIHQLRLKPHMLPGDLRELYRQMMEKISRQHQVEATMMFRCLEVWTLAMYQGMVSARVWSRCCELLEINPTREPLPWTLDYAS